MFLGLKQGLGYSSTDLDQRNPRSPVLRLYWEWSHQRSCSPSVLCQLCLSSGSKDNIYLLCVETWIFWYLNCSVIWLVCILWFGIISVTLSEQMLKTGCFFLSKNKKKIKWNLQFGHPPHIILTFKNSEYISCNSEYAFLFVSVGCINILTSLALNMHLHKCIKVTKWTLTTANRCNNHDIKHLGRHSISMRVHKSWTNHYSLKHSYNKCILNSK